MRNPLFVIGLALVTCSAHAENRSAIQIEKEIRVALKDIHGLEQRAFAEVAQYKSSLADLKYTLPGTLAGVVKAVIKTSGSTLLIEIVGTAPPILGRVYSIDASGSLSGQAQFSTNQELEREISNLIKITHVALEAYFSEWQEYTTDLALLGVVVPEHLSRYGSLKVMLVGSGYKVEFIRN